MFSVMYTGINFFPLCTAMVCPTISGAIVERRDQVRTTFLSFLLFMSSIFFIRWPSINGPFLTERAIISVSCSRRTYRCVCCCVSYSHASVGPMGSPDGVRRRSCLHRRHEGDPLG